MNYTTIPYRRGFLVSTNRKSKAKKITKIINDFRVHTDKKLKLLDIGTGNGEISHFLSKDFDVISVDIEDNRGLIEGYSFLITSESLPFSDDYFDIIVSNHVVEHVFNQKLHFSEMARVLKLNGIVYLATPNRLWPWEVHYQLPLIHYLPQNLFILSLKLMKKYKEDLSLITWFQLKKFVKPYFKINLCSDKLCKFPNDYYLNAPKFYTAISHLLPLKLYSLLAFIHPTMIVVLKKRK
jgi:2-polyprenyl-3-methyl-5-hydroxy-6-metoxy-1,4-benzoquinol methylase